MRVVRDVERHIVVVLLRVNTKTMSLTFVLYFNVTLNSILTSTCCTFQGLHCGNPDRHGWSTRDEEQKKEEEEEEEEEEKEDKKVVN
jgi:hypothetical protein